MKISKRFFLLLLTPFLLTACLADDNPAEDDPNQYIIDGFATTLEKSLDSYEYAINLQVEGQVEDTGEFDVDVDLYGWFEALDGIDSFQSRNVIDAMLDVDGESVQLENWDLSIANSEQFYASFEGLEVDVDDIDDSEQKLIDKVQEDYRGKSISITPEEIEKFAADNDNEDIQEFLESWESGELFETAEDTQDVLTENQLEALAELVGQSSFFDTDEVSYEGEEEVLGEDTYRISVEELDSEGLAIFFEEFGEIVGDEIEDADQAAAGLSLLVGFFEPKMDFWVSKDDETLRQVRIDLELSSELRSLFDLERDDEVRIVATISWGKFNEDFDIDEPSDAIGLAEVLEDLQQFAEEEGINLDDNELLDQIEDTTGVELGDDLGLDTGSGEESDELFSIASRAKTSFDGFYIQSNSFDDLEEAQEELQEVRDDIQQRIDEVQNLTLEADQEGQRAEVLEFLNQLTIFVGEDYDSILASFYGTDSDAYDAAFGRERDMSDEVDALYYDLEVVGGGSDEITI